MRFQSPIKNRERLYAGVDPRIKRKVQALAEYHDCSKAFVLNTLLGDKLNIKLEEHYYDNRQATRRVAR